MTAGRHCEGVPSAAVLAAWERASGEAPVQRAITLLATTTGDAPRGLLERLPIGECDGRLLALCESLFGPRITGLLSCPQCHDTVEIGFQASDIRVPPQERRESWTVDVRDRSIAFRVPNTRDLVAAMSAGDVAGVRDVLLRRCIIRVVGPDGPTSPDELDEGTVEAVAARMGDADPQANVHLAVTCPGCGHAWSAGFDVAAFVWMQVDAWAKRMLHDVHTLARAYGWSEAAIVSMTPTRRQVYLELVGE